LFKLEQRTRATTDVLLKFSQSQLDAWRLRHEDDYNNLFKSKQEQQLIQAQVYTTAKKSLRPIADINLTKERITCLARIHQERRQYANSSSWSTVKKVPWSLADACHPVTVKDDDSDSSSSEGTRTKRGQRRKAARKSIKKKKVQEEGQEVESESEEESEDSGEDTDMNDFKVK